MAEGWQKQKRKDWNLMAPEGTGCDGRGRRDRPMAETEGTGWLRRRKGGRDRMAEAEGTGWQKRKGPDGRGGRDRMAEAEETGWLA